MTVPRMAAINKAQGETPPAYIALNTLRHLVAGYMGVDLNRSKQTVDPGSAGHAQDGTSIFDMFPRSG